MRLSEILHEPLVESVWQKGRAIPDYSPAVWRQDAFGAVIRRDEHGTIGEYGWEIDHVVPETWGGTDDLSNLQPLHWRNNKAKSDKLL